MAGKQDPFTAIDQTALDKVHGGAGRVTAPRRGRDAELVRMLAEVTKSIKDLAGRSKQNDPMQLLGLLGRSGGAATTAPSPTNGSPTPLGKGR